MAPQAEEDLRIAWEARLRRLLATDPDLAAELRDLLSELGAPAAATPGPSIRVVKGTASDQATLYMAGGDVNITHR